ncbi:MAG TPA: sugar phosphate isomerase/epimerase family protein [Armatimonadota bacterium]|nr:sugar phosphate isomerase/epimerase family protein [Armatimonadota bacterium]
MRVAYMVNTPDVDPRGVLGMTGDVAENLGLLADLGFGAVELQVRDPSRIDRPAIERALDAVGLAVCCVCTGEVLPQDGLSLTDPNPVVRDLALARLRDMIDLASTWGCCVNIGRLRGQYVAGVPERETRTWGLDAFTRAADYAEPRGVTLVLEPIAPPFCNWINTTHEGISMYLKVARASLRLMLDTAHLEAVGEEPGHAVETAAHRLAHVHIAGRDRQAPDADSPSLRSLVSAMRAIGYTGALSAELRAQDHREAARRTMEALLPLLS